MKTGKWRGTWSTEQDWKRRVGWESRGEGVKASSGGVLAAEGVQAQHPCTSTLSSTWCPPREEGSLGFISMQAFLVGVMGLVQTLNLTPPPQESATLLANPCNWSDGIFFEELTLAIALVCACQETASK